MAAHDVPGTDVLSDVMTTLGLETRLFCRTELSAPWALAFPKSDFAHFHAIERGGGWIELDGRKEPVPLTAGDLVVVPRGGAYRIADAPGRRAKPLKEALRTERNGRCAVLREGGGGPETWMICGSFRFRRGDGHPLLTILPPVMRLPGERGQAPGWLKTTLELIGAEARSARPGSETIVSRLTDVLFVQVVRAWLESEEPAQGSWLAALADVRIGAALAAVHAHPSRAWSVAGLAAEAGMSRSPFAARFTAVVGEPPLAYVTRWRIQLACALLESPDLSLAEIASRVGYETETAFNRAFKRARGLPPGAFRKRAA